MTGSKLSDIDAVAFDIDGTLYPAWAFTVRCIPFFLRHIRFMHAFSAVRRFLHSKSAADPTDAGGYVERVNGRARLSK